MKKAFSLILLTGIILLTCNQLFTSCSNAKASKQVDVVNGIYPVDVHDIEWRKQFIESLLLLTPEERKKKIDEVLPRLNASLIAHLRSRNYGCDIASITYVFGSGTAKKVSSGDGETYDGYFDDQLYAVIKGGTCFGDSLMAFVQCFNGVFVIEGEETQTVGTYAPVFTIEKGKGINHYVDYRTSIWLSDQFKLPVHEGQGWNGPLLSPQRAYDMEDSLAFKQVTPEVYAGDVFDLGKMTYAHEGKVTAAKQ